MKPEHERAIGAVRAALGTSDQLERAQLLAQLTRTIYDYAKFSRGPDRDTPERDRLGGIVDAVLDYETDLFQRTGTRRDASGKPGMTAIELVDLMLDRADLENEQVTYGIVAAPGTFRGPTYGGRAVVEVPTQRRGELIVAPTVDFGERTTAPTYFAEVGTGTISVAVAPDLNGGAY
ncbi:MAG: hypothetical protein ACRDPS_16610 [Nocardioides sp.]|uniref:hypothetical protein n=1 Tax=Nocardioides sp. TaxID=35761 RepID=UPI003D6C2777